MLKHKKALALILTLLLITSTSLVAFAYTCDPRCVYHDKSTGSNIQTRPYTCKWCTDQTERRSQSWESHGCFDSNKNVVKTGTVWGDWSIWLHICSRSAPVPSS